MSDARLARARETLPAGYQFGDARRGTVLPWRPRHENAAEQLRAKAVWGGADYETWRRVKDARLARYPAARAAWDLAQRVGCNVIEGEHDLP